MIKMIVVAFIATCTLIVITETSVVAAQATTDVKKEQVQSGDPTQKVKSKAGDQKLEENGNSTGWLQIVPSTAWFLLVTMAVAGGFGGFVDGLSTTKSYQFTVGSYKGELGSFGDMLLGMAAAVAIFAVTGAILGLPDDTEIFKTMGFLRLVAWGVLSGYLGTRLLDQMSSDLVKKLASETARSEARDAVSRNETVRQNVREAEQLVSQFKANQKVLIKEKDEAEATRLLDQAIRKYELAKSSESANASVLIGLANSYSYKAEFQGSALGKDASDLWAKAIEVVSNLIKQDSRSSKAYYNRACYKALSKNETKYPLADIVGDLTRAIELDANLKPYANEDEDFKDLHGKKEFDDLVGSSLGGKAAIPKPATA